MNGGIERTDLVEKQSEQEYFIHVADLVQRQLKEWSEDYKVYIMKLTNYELTIKYRDQFYRFEISEEELKLLKEVDPYALDRKLWNELQNQGLVLQKRPGTYLETIFA